MSIRKKFWKGDTGINQKSIERKAEEDVEFAYCPPLLQAKKEMELVKNKLHNLQIGIKMATLAYEREPTAERETTLDCTLRKLPHHESILQNMHARFEKMRRAFEKFYSYPESKILYMELTMNGTFLKHNSISFETKVLYIGCPDLPVSGFVCELDPASTSRYHSNIKQYHAENIRKVDPATCWLYPRKVTFSNNGISDYAYYVQVHRTHPNAFKWETHSWRNVGSSIYEFDGTKVFPSRGLRTSFTQWNDSKNRDAVLEAMRTNNVQIWKEILPFLIITQDDPVLKIFSRRKDGVRRY